MNRRVFLRAGSLGLSLGGLLPLAGCGGDESRQTGTVVQTPPEDLESMEASAAAYRAEAEKQRAPRKKKP